MTFLVGLDLGTTGFRYECYNIEGKVLDRSRSEVKAQSSDEWLNAFLQTVPSKPVYSNARDVILSVQSTSGTLIMVNKFGDAVFDPIMYFEKAVDEYKEIADFSSVKEISKMGISISSTSPLPKILRVKKKAPEKFIKVKWILSPTTWLLYRLTLKEGEEWRNVETDWTNALKIGEDITGDKPKWFQPLFNEAKLDLGLLPNIVKCGNLIGKANSKLAEKVGLKGARMFQGMTDGNASALAVGCLKEGDFGFSCGTTTAFKYVSTTMKEHPAIYYHLHPFKGYLAGAAPITAGMLEWFSKKVMGIELNEAFKLAEKSTPMSETSLYFPQGDRSPFNDPLLGASFLRLWPNETSISEARGSIFKAMALGLTFQEKHYIQIFENLFNKRIVEAKITGGGIRSSWWNRIRASIYGFPVKVMEERPGIGALIPAALTEGLFSSYEEAGEALLKATNIYEPEEHLALRYKKDAELFLKRWENVRSASDID